MTVSTTDSVKTYSTGGPNFPIPFRFLQNSDIEAVLVKQDGTTETLTGAQYSLTGAGTQGGGTLTSAYAASVLALPGATLTISRVMIAVQPTDLRNQGRFLAETHENVFDRLTMLIQQGFAESSRALKRPIGNDYFDAEGWRIANLANPLSPQDAATRGWAEAFIASILATGQGPVNNAANVIYVAPDGSITVVQAMSGQAGSGLIGYSAAGPNTVPRTVQDKLRELVSRADYATDAAFNAARSGKPSIDADGSFEAKVKPANGGTPVQLGKFVQEESPNGPRDMLVWAAAQTVTLSGDTWCMGGFRRFGKYVKSRAPVFKAPTFQNAMTLPDALAHGMASSTLNNWYAAFAVANDADATASFKVAPFLFVKSVVGSVCTLGRCGEVTDVNVIDNATYTWADNALAGTDVLVLNEIFLSGTPSWTMRVAKITANTAGTVTLDTIGSVGPKCMLLPAPAGWQHYRYCASFYLDTAEVRNMFDGGGGPVRCRMAGTNVVYAHGNNGTNSTYLDGVVPSGTKRIDLSRFIPPLATGVYLQSGYQLASSSFPMRADMFFDMDGSIHTPEVHTFQKDSAEVNAVPLTVFLTFKGGQFYMPSTGGTNASVIARVSQTVTGWFEP